MSLKRIVRMMMKMMRLILISLLFFKVWYLVLVFLRMMKMIMRSFFVKRLVLVILGFLVWMIFICVSFLSLCVRKIRKSD